MNHTLRVCSFRRVPQAFVLSILFPLGLTAQSINFYGIGELDTGTFSQVRDATRTVDGNIIAVGSAMQHAGGFAQGDISVSWTFSSSGVLAPLPDVVPSSSTAFVTARVISLDGSIIGGSAHTNASNNQREPALWTNFSAPPTTGLGVILGNSGVNGFSISSAVAYGFTTYTHDSVSPFQAFRYTSGGSAVPLGFLSGDDGSSPAAHAVSTDGTVMVGISYNSAVSGGFGPGTKAFRYTYTGITGNAPGGNMSALSLLGGGTWSAALAMTPDGNKAIGVADSTGFVNGQLVSWDSAGAVTALGSPNPAFGFVNLGGVSADGSVVVVSAGDAIDVNALSIAYFKNTYGWFDFQTAMTLAGVDLAGWTLTDVLGVSADGTLVYGSGLHGSNTEGWVLSLPSDYLSSVTSIPEPSTCAMLMGAAGLCVVVWRRRKAAFRQPRV